MGPLTRTAEADLKIISVIAEQAANIDPNPERKKWPAVVGKQDADDHNDLVKAAENCALR